SVGQPRDGDPRAAWLLLDLDELTASYHRAAYDVAGAAAAIRAARLPDSLAARPEYGQRRFKSPLTTTPPRAVIPRARPARPWRPSRASPRPWRSPAAAPARAS